MAYACHGSKTADSKSKTMGLEAIKAYTNYRNQEITRVTEEAAEMLWLNLLDTIELNSNIIYQRLTETEGGGVDFDFTLNCTREDIQNKVCSGKLLTGIAILHINDLLRAKGEKHKVIVSSPTFVPTPQKKTEIRCRISFMVAMKAYVG
jgi:hypothetical protein